MSEVVHTLLPYVPQALTAVIAALAIIYSRKSARDSLSIQLHQRIWEKRADVYLEMIESVKRQNPFKWKTLEWMKERTNEGKKVNFLAEDMTSPEWESLVTRINALASDEVLSLYELWRSAIGQHTWTAAKALMHLDAGSSHHDEAQREYKSSMTSIRSAEELLAKQVRIELAFEFQNIPDIRVKTGISGVTEIVSIDGEPPS